MTARFVRNGRRHGKEVSNEFETHVDNVRNVADALREFADKIIYELEKKGEKNG